MANESYLFNLLKKYISGKCSTDEVQELMRHFVSAESDTLENEIYNFIKDEDEKPVKVPPDYVLNNIKAAIAGKGLKVKKTLWFKWAVAATVALFIAVGGLLYKGGITRAPAVEYSSDIPPGSVGGTLTLADGKKILITKGPESNMAVEAGVVITKGADGSINYTIKGGKESTAGYNTLTTGSGQQIKVTLTDGTLIVLNAESALRYKADFTAVRDVELRGEAYFTVTHMPNKPFTVHSKGQLVKVLGTRFNMSVYENEDVAKTTLLQGSVKVTANADKKNNVILKPLQQLRVSKTGEITVNTVNAADAIAWAEGKFIFEREDISSVMKKLQRWYNVEVVYTGTIPDVTFTGSVSKAETISKILEKIAYTDAVHFKIVGRKVYVVPLSG